MSALLSSVLVAAALSLGSTGREGTDARQEAAGATAPAAWTQADAEEIQRVVKAGHKVSILDDQGREVTGRIGELKADALTVLVGGDRTDVPYNRILRIDRPHDGLANGALIGFGVGAALGFAAVLSEETNDCDPSAFFGCGDPTGAAYIVAPLFVGGIGAGVGVAVDAMIRRDRKLYRRPGANAISVSPALGRGRRGIAVAVSW